MLTAVAVHRAGHGLFDFGPLFEQIVIDRGFFFEQGISLFGFFVGPGRLLQRPGGGGNPVREGDKGFDGRFAAGFIRVMEIFGQDIGELSLTAQGDELHGGQAKLGAVAATGFAECMVQRFYLFKRRFLLYLRQFIVLVDYTGKAVGGLALEEGIQSDFTFCFISEAKGFKERIVSGFIFGLNQCVDQTVERH